MSDATEAQDRAAMERLASGDDSVLEALIERHAGQLHAYLFRLLQNTSDAEDLAQEAFARVYHHRRRYDPTHLFSQWLYAIAGNLVRDRYRWRTRHPEVALEGGPAPGGLNAHSTASEGMAAFLPDREPTPAQAHLDQERETAVRTAIAELPPDLREALVLAEYENLSHAAIAQTVGGSIKAVESRLYRARQHLKLRLAKWLAQ